MITLFLIDDHVPMRAMLRLRLSLEADIVVIGEATTGVETFALVSAFNPQVVLIDVMTPIPDLDSAANLLGDVPSSSAVIVLSLYDDPTTRTYLLAAGAAAVVSKHDPDDRLLAVIRSLGSSSSSVTP